MNGKWKRILCGILSLVLIMTAVSCGNQGRESSEEGKTTSSQTSGANNNSSSGGSAQPEDTSSAASADTSSTPSVTPGGTSTDFKTILAPKIKNAFRPWVGWTGTKPSENGNGSGENSQDPGGEVESSTHSMLQTYIYSPTSPQYQSKKEFLPSVGYYPDGDLNAVPTDTMFDTFIFLSSPGHHHSGGNGKYTGITLMTKPMMEAYYDCMFKSGVNMDALDAAAGEVKQILGRPHYKVNVFLTLFNTHPDVKSFGKVDGVSLNFSREEDRFAGMKWQIDEQIRRFQEKNYQNVQIAGFFYVTEGLMSDGDEAAKIIPTVQYASTYAASLGYESLWNPYNSWMTGYTRWRELEVTRATMQINYFPLTAAGTQQSNTQPKEQIEDASRRTAEHGLGITLEWSCLNGALTKKGTEYDGVKYFKEYMEGGVKYGFMNRAFCNYQLDGGPSSIYQDCLKSNDAYTISLYREMYKFIKCTLTVDDIQWE